MRLVLGKVGAIWDSFMVLSCVEANVVYAKGIYMDCNLSNPRVIQRADVRVEDGCVQRGLY